MSRQIMSYTLCSFTVKPEKIREVKRALAELVGQIRREEPRTFYLVFREAGKPVFFALIAFENEAARRRHAQSRHLDHFVKKLLPSCEGKPRFTDLDQFATSKRQWVLEPSR
jgi:quinol monooxygenase YgiN